MALFGSVKNEKLSDNLQEIALFRFYKCILQYIHYGSFHVFPPRIEMLASSVFDSLGKDILK